ncbi:Cytosolic sulfotransferase [Thalictrum thalictroides]|uniref:Sulfotransferase n=1 Tax=Thalictrum thalictroides TaxID=46969 RepID=A0A7J6VH40_THATH|nr:Cytosolic sulfotransferase [Thalictrum thalictroides]
MALIPFASSSSISLPKYLHEDQNELSQECRHLMSSLPRDKGWVVNHLFNYQGFWHTTRQLQGVLASQKLFQAQQTDLFLVTTPKSGTTWLKAMAFAILNRDRYPCNNDHHPLLYSNPHDLVPFLELKLYVDNNVPDFTNFVSPRLFSTHMPYISLPDSIKNSKCKIVYLCRNPRDTLISLWHFTNKLRPKTIGNISLEEAFEKFCKGVSLCGPFWDHVLEYWKQSLEMPERVLFVKYEEIKEEPKVHLNRLAKFLGYPFSVEEEKLGVVDEILNLCSFDSLSNLMVNRMGKLLTGEDNKAFFRKGEVGDSGNYLTPEMIQHLDVITENKFIGYGLEV